MQQSSNSSIYLFDMSTVHNEYKLLGVVHWFVCHFSPSCSLQFVVTVARGKQLVFELTPKFNGEASYVFYLCCLKRPFDGLKIKGGEKITVEVMPNKAIVKKIGIHLLYLNQHGNVTSLPAVVDHSYTAHPQRFSARHINSSNNNIPNEFPQVRSGAGDINSSFIKEQSSVAVFNKKENVFHGKCFFGKCFSGI